MKRARAIIIEDNKLLVVKRTKVNEVYWVLPGGGVEDGETVEQAMIREGKEELDLDLKVKNLTAIIKSGKKEAKGQEEFFYQCEIVGGQLRKGNGPEFQEGNNYKGSYDFGWISIKELDKYDLRSEEIKSNIIKDFYKKYGY